MPSFFVLKLEKYSFINHDFFFLQKETPDGINIICQERLSIVDLSEHGRQPFINHDKNFAFAVNGEIFNYDEVNYHIFH